MQCVSGNVHMMEKKNMIKKWLSLIKNWNPTASSDSTRSLEIKCHVLTLLQSVGFFTAQKDEIIISGETW